MQIYFIEELHDFNGITLGDGILVKAKEGDLANLLTSCPARSAARILTTVVHETAHFLARYSEGDYNYSSPGKISNSDVT